MKSSRREFVGIAASAALGAPCARSAARITLAQGGKSTYSICLAADASPSEKRGAAELQKFLAEMSGARLPIVTDAENTTGDLLLVGRSKITDRLKLNIPFDKLGREGFALKTSGRNLVIAGGRQRGTMYGVYAFLDRLGCRWFTPDVSRIPKLDTLSIAPLDVTEVPAFEYREPGNAAEGDRDWATRNRINGARAAVDESTGGKIQYYPFVHTFYQLVPPDKYFKEHPEYFSLVDGKRSIEIKFVPGSPGSRPTQLCLTNPDVLRIATATVLDWMNRHPEADFYSVSATDSEGWCECENCRRVEEEEGGVHVGPILRFVNSIAEAVEKQHPDKLIDTLGYWWHEAPPKTRPRRNVRIRFCPITACQAHPFERCPHNQNVMNNLRGWAKLSNQLYVWHYTINFQHSLLPFPDFDELAADIPMYKRNGVVGIFLQGGQRAGGALTELRSYVMARLMWDTKTDVKRAIDEFQTAYYGEKAAQFMAAYFDLLHRQVRMPPNGEGRHMWFKRSPYISEQASAEASKLLDQAEAAAPDDAVRRRVRKERLSIEYLEVLRAQTFSVRGATYTPADLDALRARFQAFMKEARTFGMNSFGEGGSADAAEKDFAARIKPYPVTALENQFLRLHIAPDLSGRIIQMTDKRTGKEALRRGQPGERLYPDVGGLGVFPCPEVYSRAWDSTWQLDTASANEVVLRGACANGLQLRRTIRLKSDEATVYTETVATNRGTAPLEISLQAVLDVNPDPVDFIDFDSSIRREDGSMPTEKVSQRRGPAYSSRILSDNPAGEWKITNHAVGMTILNRFPKEQARRCAVRWSQRGEKSGTCDLWSQQRTLAPGESFTLNSDYSVVA
jgi:hypothetical protein